MEERMTATSRKGDLSPWCAGKKQTSVRNVDTCGNAEMRKGARNARHLRWNSKNVADGRAMFGPKVAASDPPEAHHPKGNGRDLGEDGSSASLEPLGDALLQKQEGIALTERDGASPATMQAQVGARERGAVVSHAGTAV
jgi:hypothetical protein